MGEVSRPLWEMADLGRAHAPFRRAKEGFKNSLKEKPFPKESL